VNERTLERFELLAKSLISAAAAVLALSLIGALVVATSETALPVVDEFTRQNRGTFAIGALCAGVTAAGGLAGLGAILRLLVAGWRADYPAPQPATQPRPQQPPPQQPPQRPRQQPRQRPRPR
jgi:hypothetical protein